MFVYPFYVNVILHMPTRPSRNVSVQWGSPLLIPWAFSHVWLYPPCLKGSKCLDFTTSVSKHSGWNTALFNRTGIVLIVNNQYIKITRISDIAQFLNMYFVWFSFLNIHDFNPKLYVYWLTNWAGLVRSSERRLLLYLTPRSACHSNLPRTWKVTIRFCMNSKGFRRHHRSMEDVVEKAA